MRISLFEILAAFLWLLTLIVWVNTVHAVKSWITTSLKAYMAVHGWSADDDH